jgi:hypothetical protein
VDTFALKQTTGILQGVLSEVLVRIEMIDVFAALGPLAFDEFPCPHPCRVQGRAVGRVVAFPQVDALHHRYPRVQHER